MQFAHRSLSYFKLNLPMVGALGLFSIGIEVAFTLLFSIAGSALTLPVLTVSAASSLFSSASVAAFVSLASSFRAAAFLLGVASSSGPSATWKLIWVPKRG